MKTFAVLLDILIVLLIAVPLIDGAVRGFRRRVFSLLCAVVSAAAAFAVCTIFAEPIYERFFSHRVYLSCLDAVGEYDLVSQAQQLLSENGVEVSEEDMRAALSSQRSLPESVSELAVQNGADADTAAFIESEIESVLSGGMQSQTVLAGGLDGISSLEVTQGEIYDAARAYAQSPEAAAEYLEQNFAAPIAVSMVRSLLYVAAFSLMGLIMRLALWIFGIDLSAPPASALDRVGGAALGVISGVINAALLVIVVGFIEQACGDFFALELEGSRVFMRLYEILF